MENEVRILEIQKDFEEKIIKMGAEKKGEFFQKRYVYDVKPINPNKWIRLRTNGKKTTLTIKEIKNDKIDGTMETEVEVSDFNKTNLILENLGFYHRNYQENKRILYLLNGVEIAIDSWPLIPTYAEIEGKSVEDVKNTLKLLNIKDYVTLDVTSIYKKYGIDLLKIKELRFDD